MNLMVCCEMDDKERVPVRRGRGRIEGEAVEREAVEREAELNSKSEPKVNQR